MLFVFLLVASQFSSFAFFVVFCATVSILEFGSILESIKVVQYVSTTPLTTLLYALTSLHIFARTPAVHLVSSWLVFLLYKFGSSLHSTVRIKRQTRRCDRSSRVNACAGYFFPSVFACCYVVVGIILCSDFCTSSSRLVCV